MFRDSLKPCFKLLAEKVNELEAEFDNYPTVDEANEALKEYALKKDIPALVDTSGYALKTDIPEPVDFRGYVLKRELDKVKTENSTLKATITAMETRLAALENNLNLVEYTFEKSSSTNIRYIFGQPLNAYKGTIYLSYTETKNNVTSVKEIKVNDSYSLIPHS
ncbi:hypothetical protein M9Y10_038350 [Tritrichomonas musculus]|uniref:KE2 family protein n=1 Tax=Tritrichomonas musculus TaxID=1915356 RepID=A0ABR2K9Z0_9EUKA